MNVVATLQTRLRHGIICEGRHCQQFPPTLSVSKVQQHRSHGMSTSTGGRYTSIPQSLRNTLRPRTRALQNNDDNTCSEAATSSTGSSQASEKSKLQSLHLIHVRQPAEATQNCSIRCTAGPVQQATSPLAKLGPNELIAQNQENVLHKGWRARHTFGTTGYGPIKRMELVSAMNGHCSMHLRQSRIGHPIV